MANGLRLEQRLGQSLVMTPQLQQAIKLLQLSNIELQDYVAQEIERNPLLDPAPAGDPDTSGADAEAGESGDAGGEETLAAAGEFASREVLAGETRPLDTDYANVYDADLPPGPGTPGVAVRYGPGGRADFDDAEGLESTLTRPKSLREHVEEQIGLEIADAGERLIAAHLIEQLDESGYFVGDTAAVADRLGCETALVEDVLRRAQDCEPAGLFARSLAECLGLQLAARDLLDEPMRRLLDHLDLVARRDGAALAAHCGVDEDRIVEMVRVLRSLDPKPGLAFDQETAQTVVPDIHVRAGADGNWVLTLNNDTLPRVLVNTRYYARVSRSARRREDKAFLQESLQSANWLVRALDQRANTILKVASEIVRQQDGFLTHGVRHLRPLTLREVAEQVDMHESTISRVTSNKFMATPRGIFELKYFFSAAIPGKDGLPSHSAEAVRARIRDLIADEASGTVLSDDRLVDILADSGIDIARRTVAKYRESLGIPSSVERRRQQGARF